MTTTGCHVYILRCRDGSLYTGAAKVLERRVEQHRVGRASRYTRSRRPVTLVWSVVVSSWPEALRLEARIKRLPRSAKLALVASGGVRRRQGRHARPRRRKAEPGPRPTRK